ncbi:MAG: transposase [Kofleriaceae bacterium]
MPTKPKRRRKSNNHGGARPGAGRPPKGEFAGHPHKGREAFRAKHPVHVVMRTLPVAGNLRRPAIHEAVRSALTTIGKHEDCRVVHLSIQRDHIHLLVEADDREALSRGMRAFQISLAKRINRAVSSSTRKRRRGQIFTDRYESFVLETPRAVRDALVYVLNAWRKFEKAAPKALDPYSSALAFAGWKEPISDADSSDFAPLVLWPPRTALLTGVGKIARNEAPPPPAKKRPW